MCPILIGTPLFMRKNNDVRLLSGTEASPETAEKNMQNEHVLFSSFGILCSRQINRKQQIEEIYAYRAGGGMEELCTRLTNWNLQAVPWL